jgi:hypothetical protein
MIEQLYNNLVDNIIRLDVMQSSIDSISKRECYDIEKVIGYSANTSEDKIFQSSHNPFFKSPINGEYLFIGLIKTSIEDRKKFLKHNKNRQYQWLLTEAYELYEDFLEQIYAYIAFIDPSSWPLGNYKNLFLNDLQNQDFKFFLETARKKDINHILKFMRKKFPKLNSLEKKNALNFDYPFFLKLIEKFRHIIVHK